MTGRRNPEARRPPAGLDRLGQRGPLLAISSADARGAPQATQTRCRHYSVGRTQNARADGVGRSDLGHRGRSRPLPMRHAQDGPRRDRLRSDIGAAKVPADGVGRTEGSRLLQNLQ